MDRIRLLPPLVGLGILGCLALTGCHVDVHAGSPVKISGEASTSPDSGISVPGTHKSATAYRISSPVSTVVVISHVGNITVTGGSGSSTSVTEQATYSKTRPDTTSLAGRNRRVVTTRRSEPAQCHIATVRPGRAGTGARDRSRRGPGPPRTGARGAAGTTVRASAGSGQAHTR